MVLGISLFACQEQAATWEEMLADSLGMPFKCQANTPHPGINSLKKDPNPIPG